MLNLKPEDISLQAGTMKGGTKTKAGKDRVVPIHSKIRPLVEARLAEGGPRLLSYKGRVCSQTQYRVFWVDIMKALNMEHTPHECPHTFENAVGQLPGQTGSVLIYLWGMCLKILATGFIITRPWTNSKPPLN